MEVGELGDPGLSALKSAEEGYRKDPGDVTLLLQLMEERPAMVKVIKRENAIESNVSYMLTLSNVT